jgi:type I restriction enzyme, S subunit
MRKKVTVPKAGGRQATTRHIPPRLALSVGKPSTRPPAGWQWTKLTDVARLESGHTPSRRRPDWWGGSIPWISIKDARDNHGRRIDDTLEHTNKLGIENSAARVLPAKTVCLSRTASVGYVFVMGRPMATSQDFVNWVCSDQLEPDYLKYLFVAEGDGLLRFASGAVHQTIYFPEAKAFHICLPTVPEQIRIVRLLDAAFDGLKRIKSNTERNLLEARALFESQLQSVFNKRGSDWTDKSLEEVVDPSCSLSYGIVQPGDEYPDGLPIVRPTDLDNKLVTLTGLKRINPKLAEGYRRTTLRGGELLLCVRGTTGVLSRTSPELAGGNVTRGIVPIAFEKSTLRQDFGYYLMRSEDVQAQIKARTYGAALMQINIGDLRKITVSFPPLKEQREIASSLEAIDEESDNLMRLYKQKLSALELLKQSILHTAFTGQLTAQTQPRPSRPALATAMSTTDIHAGILAMAYRLHEEQGKVAQFTHVKAEKIAHMVEALVGLDLGRVPVKDAAGPNDFPHLLKVEHRARRAHFFDFKRGQSGAAYRVQKLRGFDGLIEKTREALGDNVANVENALKWMLQLNVQQAEIVATVYAGWNNLLLQGKSPSDDEIVNESRENWHANKMKIDRQRFFNAVQWLRKEGVVPQGTGKLVSAKDGH